MNYLKTTVLLAALAGLFILIGGLLGGQKGATLALLVAGVMNLITYWFSDKIVLAMYRAKKVSETDSPRLYRIVRRLATCHQMPLPAIYVIPDEGGGKLCGRPLALASALRKLHQAAERTPMSVGTPATASLFIVNPFGGGGVTKLFSTHPPVAERIRRLELQAGTCRT